MNILLVSSSSGSRGGGELYLLYLGQALRDRGHSLTLWASTHQRMDELALSFARFGHVIRSDYRNTYDLPGRSLAAWLNTSSASRIASDWSELAPDVIHLNKQNLEDGLDLLRASRLVARPFVCTIHLTQSARYLRARFAWIRDWISRRALLQFRGELVAVAEQREHDLIEFLGRSQRVSTIPNGVPIPDLTARDIIRRKVRDELGIRDEELLVIAVGRMVPQKRPLYFLELAAQLYARMPLARFVWIGDGALAGDWDAWVRERGLTESIRRLPWQKDVQSYLHGADLFLHAAEYEGLPLALLEAMSAGVPCALPERLRQELKFLNSSNSIAVAESGVWMRSLSDKAGLNKIGAEGRSLVEKEFSFRLMAERYELLYARVCQTSYAA